MTPERLQEIKGVLDFAAQEGVDAVEVTLLNETVMEIDRLTRELVQVQSAYEQFVELKQKYELKADSLEAENAKLWELLRGYQGADMALDDRKW